MTDLEFVRSCVKGDKLSWDEFIIRYSRLIYNYIHSVLRSKGLASQEVPAQDIFHDILVHLSQDDFAKLKTFKARNNCSLASWLRLVTINFTIEYLRKVKPAFSLDAEDEEGRSLKDILPDPQFLADKINIREKSRALRDCIAQLDIDARLFLELHYEYKVRLEQFEDFLKISRSAIDMRKARILELLKDCFRKKGFVLA